MRRRPLEVMLQLDETGQAILKISILANGLRMSASITCFSSLERELSLRQIQGEVGSRSKRVRNLVDVTTY